MSMAPSALPALKNLMRRNQLREPARRPIRRKGRSQVIATRTTLKFTHADLSHPAQLFPGSRCLSSSPSSHASGVAQRLY